METLKAPKLILDPRDRIGDTLIVVPAEDLLESDPAETEFSTGQKVVVQFPAQDESYWEVMGTVVDMDLGADDEDLLLFVKIAWEQAVPLTNATP